MPDIDITTYELEIEVLSQDPSTTAVSFTFDKLKQLPKHSVTAAVMCGGNRRSDMHKVILLEKNMYLHDFKMIEMLFASLGETCEGTVLGPSSCGKCYLVWTKTM